MKWTLRFTVVTLALGIAAGQAKKTEKTDAQIKQEIISATATCQGRPPVNVSLPGWRCRARSA